MNELLKIEVNENQEPVVSARELYEFLGIKKRFSAWWETQVGYGFEEGEDFCSVLTSTHQNQYGGEKELQDYAIKIDMAKELAMVSKSEKGKKARKYFIQIEKDWNSPEKVMARALVMANKTIHTLEIKLEEARPMIEFAETVAASSDSIDMGEMAKLCCKEGISIGRNRLFELLRNKGVLRPNNEPYQKYIDSDWFEVQEITKRTPYGEKLFVKSLVKGKGQIKIVELVRSEHIKKSA